MNLLKSFYNFVQNIRFSKTFERDIQNFYVSYIVGQYIHGLYQKYTWIVYRGIIFILINFSKNKVNPGIDTANYYKKSGFKKGMLAVERQFSLKWKDMENIKYNPLQKTIR